MTTPSPGLWPSPASITIYSFSVMVPIIWYLISKRYTCHGAEGTHPNRRRGQKAPLCRTNDDTGNNPVSAQLHIPDE